jgi:trans-2,3-dihydro-3-hydroxyanthranilate isomerase
MNTATFFITDVFGIEKYTGNQLATFVNCSHFSDEEMQQIAREINFSETTFILSDLRNGGYDVRIFTPESELDFAGHPTLGTAFIIQQTLQNAPTDAVRLNLKVGQVPVFFPEDKMAELLWMKQIEPRFGQTFQPEDLAPVLTLPETAFHDSLPIEEVSTGLPFLVVPLKSMEYLKQAFIQIGHYNKFLEKTSAKGVLIFCAPGYTDKQDFAVRVFVPCLGVPEDPATGSANGCLSGYLVEHGYPGQKRIETTVGQGYEIGRPSELFLQGEKIDGKIDVRVGGKVILVARGEWG